MTKLTIVYTDGNQEHYNIIETTHSVNTITGLKYYKEMIEDDMLKLVIEGSQIVLIPIINIRKIISQIDDPSHLKVQDYPGFMSVKVVE